MKKSVVVEENNDIWLVLRGWFDKSHRHYFEANQDYLQRGYFELTYSLDPPLAAWEPGSYQRVVRRSYKKLPNVPYRFQNYFNGVRKDERGNWVSTGRWGEFSEIGWRADLGEASTRVESPTR